MITAESFVEENCKYYKLTETTTGQIYDIIGLTTSKKALIVKFRGEKIILVSGSIKITSTPGVSTYERVSIHNILKGSKWIIEKE